MMEKQIPLIDELPGLIGHSITLLQEHEPPEGFYGCFSGGKDSLVIKELARMAGVSVTWHYNVTTIDPPELVRYIRSEHPDVEWIRNERWNFFKALAHKGYPHRRSRWCCTEFKEHRTPRDRVLILGIRSEESVARASSWAEVKRHHITGALTIQPILQWASDEVWQFIRSRGLSYCSLYDEGFHRLGCIGCPVANKAKRRAEFERWPRYEKLWKKAFRRLWDKRKGHIQRDGRPWFGERCFDNWEQLWDWWMSDSPPPNNDEPIFDCVSSDESEEGCDVRSK